MLEDQIENNSEVSEQEAPVVVTVKVVYDLETMEVIGYYPSYENYSEIPEPNITVSEEEWRDAIRRPKSQVKEDLSGLEEYQASEAEIVAALKLDLIGVRRNYLRESAVYYAPDFPENILQKRSLARSEIEQIQLKNSVEELNNFSTDYSCNFN